MVGMQRQGATSAKFRKIILFLEGRENSPFLEKMMASIKISVTIRRLIYCIHILDDCAVKKSSSCIGGDVLSVFFRSPT